MPVPEFRGRPIVIFSRKVYGELAEMNMTLWDVREVLESGFDCSRSPRRTEVLERCVQQGRKALKVVVQEGEHELYGSIWLLRHVGKLQMRREWGR